MMNRFLARSIDFAQISQAMRWAAESLNSPAVVGIEKVAEQAVQIERELNSPGMDRVLRALARFAQNRDQIEQSMASVQHAIEASTISRQQAAFEAISGQITRLFEQHQALVESLPPTEAATLSEATEELAVTPDGLQRSLVAMARDAADGIRERAEQLTQVLIQYRMVLVATLNLHILIMSAGAHEVSTDPQVLAFVTQLERVGAILGWLAVLIDNATE